MSQKYYENLTNNNNLGIHPNVDELFKIIETAIRQNNLVGTFSTYEDICAKKEIVYIHQYAITDAFISKSIRILKLQNPWNKSDRDGYKWFILINILVIQTNLFNTIYKHYITHHSQSSHRSLVSLHNLPAISNGEL